MLDHKTGVPKPGQRLLPGSVPSSSPRQRRLMLVALALLLVSLVTVLYRDRDFWFPDTEEADGHSLSPPQTQDISSPVTTASGAAVPRKKETRARAVPHEDPQSSDNPPIAGPTVTATRTVLPPLEVEVVAGDVRQTLHPSTNAVHVDLQRAPSGQVTAPVRDDAGQTVARVATPAAQRATVSTTAASEIVSRSVQPDYPMLARQMKVQGSVIMQALIGRDGLIEDLHVLSGPPILANAAEEAVRQWHFKPHFVGTQPVETRANITVNFTISTN